MTSIAAGAALAAAPAALVLGTATSGHADTGAVDARPSFSAPAHHTAFPPQNLSIDPPGTPAPHHQGDHRRR